MTHEFFPPPRLLMGPGPSNVSPVVLEAMGRPLVGHLDPFFVALMNEIQDDLRSILRTSNRLTLPISGTGSAGMEAAVMNFVEPGDSVLVCIHGVFGMRLAEEVRRAGGTCHTVSVPFGQPLDPEEIRRTAASCRPRLIAVVHAETSTGVLQPLEPIREICDDKEALFLVDTVTSLGGHPVLVDDWEIDICYSGTQKCLSCPPGLAPFSASPRAVERLASRKAPVQSWYLDLQLVRSYWGEERTYHHTAPISMNYALHQSLKLVLEEGLENRWDRHRRNHRALVSGLQAMGIEMLVHPDYRLWSLNTAVIPEGVDDMAVRRELLSRFNVEIGGGLGELKGKVWRIGLMGESSRIEHLLYFLHALGQSLVRQGHLCSGAEGIAAALSSLEG